MRKRKIYTVAISLSIIFSLLVVVELAMRAGYLAPSFSNPDNSMEIVLDRKKLYKMKPFSTTGINMYGYRDYYFHMEKPVYKKRILVLGDSFVAGTGVNFSQTIPKELERRLDDNYEVFNMGVHGYGPGQSLIRLTNKGLLFNPDVVILCIYAANDFGDIYKNGVFMLDGNDNLIINKENAVNSKLPKLNILYLAHYLLFKLNIIDPAYYQDIFYTLFVDSHDYLSEPDSPETRKKIALMKAILNKFKEILTEKSIEFYVVILPSYCNIQDDSHLKKTGITPDKYFVNEDIAHEICDKEGIRHINIYPYLLNGNYKSPLYSEDDWHFTPYGSQVVADLIFRNYFSSAE